MKLSGKIYWFSVLLMVVTTLVVVGVVVFDGMGPLLQPSSSAAPAGTLPPTWAAPKADVVFVEPTATPTLLPAPNPTPTPMVPYATEDHLVYYGFAFVSSRWDSSPGFVLAGDGVVLPIGIVQAGKEERLYGVFSVHTGPARQRRNFETLGYAATRYWENLPPDLPELGKISESGEPEASLPLEEIANRKWLDQFVANAADGTEGRWCYRDSCAVHLLVGPGFDFTVTFGPSTRCLRSDDGRPYLVQIFKGWARTIDCQSSSEPGLSLTTSHPVVWIFVGTGEPLAPTVGFMMVVAEKDSIRYASRLEFESLTGLYPIQARIGYAPGPAAVLDARFRAFVNEPR